MTDVSACSIYNNRVRNLLFNTLPPRVELQNSPYSVTIDNSSVPIYTTEQIYARRKYEVLKRNSNSVGSTKKQRNITMLSNSVGSLSKNMLFAENINNGDNPCYIPPDIANIPLYDYIIPKRSYAIINKSTTNSMNIYPFIDSLMPVVPDQSFEEALYIHIENYIDRYELKNHTFLIPVGIYIEYDAVSEGINLNNNTLYISMETEPELNIYFGGQIVNTLTPVFMNNTFFSASASIESQSPFIYPDSKNIQIKINPTVSAKHAFYIGDLIMNNLDLYTESGYTYDIKFRFSFNYSIPTTNLATDAVSKLIIKAICFISDKRDKYYRYIKVSKMTGGKIAINNLKVDGQIYPLPNSNMSNMYQFGDSNQVL